MKKRIRYKNPEERKKEILIVARQLIRVVSFEALRLDNLLAKLELSKGGFYHHFKSTSELLEGLIEEDVTDQLARMHSAETTDNALDGLIQMLQAGSSHLGSPQGVLLDIKEMEGRRLYVDILERTFDTPVLQLVQKNLKRGVKNKEYLPHDTTNAATLFSAANSYGNRRLILGDWSIKENLSFSLFSLEIFSKLLGVGNRLIEIFPSV
jgi:AcrR family transcriptional regulator